VTDKVAIDLITVRPDGAHVLVLVEEGPWEPDAVDSQLRKLQGRLYNAVDVAVDGFLASKYPDSKGGPVIIRLDCYDVPRRPVEEFFLRFSDHIKADVQVRADIDRKGFISRLALEFNWRTPLGG
jgi:hypothetical protein